MKERTQLCTDIDNYVGFYEPPMAARHCTSQAHSPIHTFDGWTLIGDKAGITSLWSEHFHALFSANQVVPEAESPSSPQGVNIKLNPLSNMAETIKATVQLKNGKEDGVDGIPPEILKPISSLMLQKLHDLLLEGK